ncbi:Hypothetical protein PAU_00090 [Photorhabdus asymbiotica]|uniref:Uncharacterized protein n=1 Tax=Photorhabdus asymbiotica subsp. asymbiotica (strain ATCC 43949 / 3105-77) TaxID=553480 RepID=C7BU31_PHOAA|nr:Hypothetical protein PAU_00090 [Photorhabdus asymbiotica]
MFKINFAFILDKFNRECLTTFSINVRYKIILLCFMQFTSSLCNKRLLHYYRAQYHENAPPPAFYSP